MCLFCVDRGYVLRHTASLIKPYIGKLLFASLLITAAAPLLLRLFTTSPGILFNAREAVQFNLPVYVVYAMNQVWLGAIKGFGKTLWPMLCTLLCYALFRVLWCTLLIPVFQTMRVVYLSYDVSFFLMMLLLLPVWRRLIAGAWRSHCAMH